MTVTVRKRHAATGRTRGTHGSAAPLCSASAPACPRGALYIVPVRKLMGLPGGLAPHGSCRRASPNTFPLDCGPSASPAAKAEPRHDGKTTRRQPLDMPRIGCRCGPKSGWAPPRMPYMRRTECRPMMYRIRYIRAAQTVHADRQLNRGTFL